MIVHRLRLVLRRIEKDWIVGSWLPSKLLGEKLPLCFKPFYDFGAQTNFMWLCLGFSLFGDLPFPYPNILRWIRNSDNENRSGVIGSILPANCTPGAAATFGSFLPFA
jgi:hypothetical protein